MKNQSFNTVLEALSEVIKSKEDKISIQNYEIQTLKQKLAKYEKEMKGDINND